MEPGRLEQAEPEASWDGQDVCLESGGSVPCLSVKVGEGQHFEDTQFSAVTTGRHDGEEQHDGKVPVGVSVVDLHWVCGDVSDDECVNGPGGKWILVEKWNVADVVEECGVGVKVNVDGENGVEIVVGNVNVEVVEEVLKGD